MFAGSWGIVLLAGCPAFARAAEQTLVKRTVAPAWVERFAPDLSVSPQNAANVTDGDGYRFLIRDEQVHVAEQTTYRHYALRFLSQDGVREYSTLSFNFDPATRACGCTSSSSIATDRRWTGCPNKSSRSSSAEPGLEEQLYDGRSTATLILDDIRVGDVVEYAYSIRGRNPIMAGHFVNTFAAGWHDPLRQWRERLLWPTNQPSPDIQNHGATCVPKVRPLDGGKTTEFRWEANNLPGKPPESETPSWVDTYGWVQVSDFASWQEVARWSARLFAQTAPDPRQPLPEELRRTVETIRALPDRPAQVVAALRYVQDNYRYLGIEIGANSHQPYPIATVCDRRFGDCKDKANLLSTLLRLLGFDADPALVETSYRHVIGEWHPTPYAFDHAVVRLKFDGTTYWLDATREYQGGTLGHIYFRPTGKRWSSMRAHANSRMSRRRASRTPVPRSPLLTIKKSTRVRRRSPSIPCSVAAAQTVRADILPAPTAKRSNAIILTSTPGSIRKSMPSPKWISLTTATATRSSSTSVTRSPTSGCATATRGPRRRTPSSDQRKSSNASICPTRGCVRCRSDSPSPSG